MVLANRICDSVLCRFYCWSFQSIFRILDVLQLNAVGYFWPCSLQNNFFWGIWAMPFACITISVSFAVWKQVHFLVKIFLLLLPFLSLCLLLPSRSFSGSLGFIRQPTFWCSHPVNQLCVNSAALEKKYYLGQDKLNVEECTTSRNSAINLVRNERNSALKEGSLKDFRLYCAKTMLDSLPPITSHCNPHSTEIISLVWLVKRVSLVNHVFTLLKVANRTDDT